jgi:polysaccharide export outer membrane protein
VGDSIAVRLSGVPANDQGIYEVRVDEGGSISMPYVGNIHAAGTTSVDLKQRIEAAYRQNGIFPTCNIQIFTKEVRFVNINGEVRAPQRLAYTKDLTVTGAISACGGFTEYANKRKVIILRNGQPLTSNVLEILKNPALDVQLLPGDTVQVNRSIL